ncbi:MAG: hypothetical protein GQ542_18090 [Desulforhopalus sp.]|nr:hypothetical protein [Desulforhopalus sp.]
MEMKSVGRIVGKYSGLILLMVLMTGCTSGMTGETDSSVPLTSDDLAPVATMVESYGDIELPIEMTLSQNKSIAMRTDSFQGGIHSYSGRVQINSLRDYIIVSMRNNKWRLVGEASYKNVMLAFKKPNKTCMFVLSESLGKTQANLYVTVDVAAENKLNPFGGSINQ